MMKKNMELAESNKRKAREEKTKFMIEVFIVMHYKTKIIKTTTPNAN